MFCLLRASCCIPGGEGVRWPTLCYSKDSFINCVTCDAARLQPYFALPFVTPLFRIRPRDAVFLPNPGARDAPLCQQLSDRVTRSNRFVPQLSMYQQKPNNRILLLPFINGSQAQKVRLLDFWPSKDTIYFSERNLERTYNEIKRFIFVNKEFLSDVSDDSKTKLLLPYFRYNVSTRE